MASKLDELLPTIIDAGDSGLSIGKITEKFAGKSKVKERSAELREKLAALVRDGAIWGPLKHGATLISQPAAAPRSRPQAKRLLDWCSGAASSCCQRLVWKRR
jgi:hypothetical protein